MAYNDYASEYELKIKWETTMNNWIDEFRAPLELLTGLPNLAFYSAEFAEFERDHILSKTWFCVANEAQLPRDRRMVVKILSGKSRSTGTGSLHRKITSMVITCPVCFPV